MNRPVCPSCHTRATPLALECPVCGLVLPRRALPRPLLFQASALGAGAPREEPKHGISAPALGRVEPLTLVEPVEPVEPALSLAPSLAELGSREEPAREPEAADTFWPVVRMEGGEFLALAGLNLVLAGLAGLASWAWPGRVYPEFWPYLLPVHLAVSWAYLMVPLVLVGQSPMMGRLRLAVDTDLPERRMAFSLLHLVSTICFPLSFLCMVLTPDHRTLAELLSGQEVLQLPYARMR